MLRVMKENELVNANGGSLFKFVPMYYGNDIVGFMVVNGNSNIVEYRYNWQKDTYDAFTYHLTGVNGGKWW